MSNRDDIVICTARRDYEDVSELYIPEDANVIEQAEGYWVSAWLFVKKEPEAA